MSETPRKLALIGGRGYTGAELLKILSRHSGFEVALVTSRRLAGELVGDHFDVEMELEFEDLDPADAVSRDNDAWVLALPNGLSGPWVEAIREASDDAAIVDLSSDHRFDDSWVYGQPERNRGAIQQARFIANPGCYATGAQLVVWALRDVLEGPAHIFGVSGYSGAGTTPNPRNDLDRLRDNLMPYALTGHTHEREVSHQLGVDVNFMPHVASFFRGISLTISLNLIASATREDLVERLSKLAEEPLISFQDEVPEVADAVGEHGVTIGGLHVDEERHHAVVVATLDNLLKGAATQAVQNLNLVAGFDEYQGILS